MSRLRLLVLQCWIVTGVVRDDMRFVRHVDLRYIGQSYELDIVLEDSDVGAGEVERLAERSHVEHERVYGFKNPDEPIEVVTLRLSAGGNIAKPRLREVKGRSIDPSLAQVESRSIYFVETRGYLECPFTTAVNFAPGPGLTVQLLYKKWI